MSTPTGIAVVLPIKSFSAAKARLADALSPDARRQLARRCADAVFAAAGTLPIFVVCDDAEVTAWATQHGAKVVTPTQPGLNHAVDAGRLAARDAGFARVLVVHSDLPNAEHLATLADEPTDVVIVPDRHSQGTNALLLPADGIFTFHYGLHSYDAHRSEARLRGLSLCVVQRPDLALDLDTPDDLRVAGLLP